MHGCFDMALSKYTLSGMNKALVELQKAESEEYLAKKISPMAPLLK